MSASRSTTFLLEVGTEEIPDRMLTAGVAGLRDKLAAALEPLQILAPGGSCRGRRIARKR
jgi:glycyl-tRNA synthetase beta subunit